MRPSYILIEQEGCQRVQFRGHNLDLIINIEMPRLKMRRFWSKCRFCALGVKSCVGELFNAGIFDLKSCILRVKTHIVKKGFASTCYSTVTDFAKFLG